MSAVHLAGLQQSEGFEMNALEETSVNQCLSFLGSFESIAFLEAIAFCLFLCPSVRHSLLRLP